MVADVAAASRVSSRKTWRGADGGAYGVVHALVDEAVHRAAPSSAWLPSTTTPGASPTNVIGAPLAPEPATVTCSRYWAGATCTVSPGPIAFLAAAEMEQNGAAWVPEPASLHAAAVASTQ